MARCPVREGQAVGQEADHAGLHHARRALLGKAHSSAAWAVADRNAVLIVRGKAIKALGSAAACPQAASGPTHTHERPDVHAGSCTHTEPVSSYTQGSQQQLRGEFKFSAGCEGAVQAPPPSPWGAGLHGVPDTDTEVV